MKITIKHDEEQTTVKRAKLIGLEQCQKKGATIMVVKTDAGNFSNYKSVFDKQGLDVEALTEGDELDISYVVYLAKNGVEFKNFVKVMLSRDSEVLDQCA